jgi:hypothetical protein
MTNKFKYNVNIEQNCTFREESEEEWGEWNAQYNNKLIDVNKSNKDSQFEVLSDFDFKVGGAAYLVWLEYSSGDSFGQSYCGGVEAIGLFKNKKCAEELENFIKKDYEDSKKVFGTNMLNYTTSDGQNFDYIYTYPWKDYFGGLENVYVEKIKIN